MYGFIREGEDGVFVDVCVKPNSKRFKIVLSDKCLEINLFSPPIGGRANRELIDVFSEIFGVSRRDIEIVSGERSRNKVVKISGISSREFIERIENFI